MVTTTDKTNRILIIDDEFSIREALSVALKGSYDIRTASNALDGLKIISSDPHFDIVIMDIKMPNMDGISALEEIKKIQPDTEVVMITAYASLHTAQQALQCGALDYIIKPFDYEDMKNIIHKGITKRKKLIKKEEKHATLMKLVQKRTKDLKITGELLKTLYTYANDGIIIMNKAGVIINANEQASKIYGYHEGRLLGQHIRILEVDPHTSMLEERMMRLLNGEALLFETEHRKKDGTLITLEISSKAIQVDDEVYIQSIHRDITEKKRLQGQLLHAQKMESIGRLSGGIAHDFNNIVASIAGFTQLMLDYKEELPPDVIELIRMIEGSSKMGSSMISKLLSFARRGQLEITALSLNTVIDETVDMVERLMRNIEIIKDLNHSIPRLKADRSKMDQIIMNLIINARDAMPDGGKIIIKTDLVELNGKNLNISTSVKEGQYICLRVQDTGIGIPEDNLQNIFEPFFTTKEEGKGTGLGLATIWGIVKEHGGYITVDSTVGTGTTFMIYVPASRTKVLVIDDEIPVLRLIKDVLYKNGYDATVFADPTQFNDFYKENWKKIDLVIADTIMPSVDAASFIKNLTSLNSQIKIIALTGLSADEVEDVNIVLKKPVEPSQLLSSLKELFP